MSVGKVGPNLTHVGSRTTIAAGLYPNDERHLRLWLKNARKMKPGVSMPTLGRGEEPREGTRGHLTAEASGPAGTPIGPRGT